MSTTTPDGMGELQVRRDGYVAAYPFELGLRREAFRSAVGQMVDERAELAPKIRFSAPVSHTTIVLTDGLYAGSWGLHGRTDDDAKGGQRVRLNARNAYNAYMARAAKADAAGGQIDWDEFNGSTPVKELTLTAVHEGSHAADNIVMGKRAVEREYFTHERRFTRKFRLPILVGMAAVAAGLPGVRSGAKEILSDLVSQNKLVAAFAIACMLGGIYVAGKMVDSGLHKIFKRSEKCLLTQPGEIRADAAAEAYEERMKAGEVPAIVTVTPKTN